MSERGRVRFIFAKGIWRPEPILKFLDARKGFMSVGCGFLGQM